ncbi:twisted gastrulation-like protein [Sarcoptes scabiei]|uniref:Twisted gastrulation-like protein n=1 Tax=Sarcoptes scabiei TaxID=52283 RepID=A0A132AIB3_SARSC|nr:twisted gastrulation-like protein [Sarcoptes scabiei]
MLIITSIFSLIFFGFNDAFDPELEGFRTSDLDNAKCDSVVCASIVSKCILTSDCKCNNILTNRSCAENCSLCLDYLYQDCCLCFDLKFSILYPDLCQKSRTNEAEEIQHRSNVGHIKDPQPDFFKLLTELPDPLERWKTISYSLKLPFLDDDVEENRNRMEGESHLEMDCTVAYLAQCISLNKCRTSCASMGSTTYRWFHDGCCQCVGKTCNEFGLEQSNCTACPLIAMEDYFNDSADPIESENDGEERNQDESGENL